MSRIAALLFVLLIAAPAAGTSATRTNVKVLVRTKTPIAAFAQNAGSVAWGVERAKGCRAALHIRLLAKGRERVVYAPRCFDYPFYEPQLVGLAGGRVVRALLGSAYGADIGSQLGLLVVVLSLWAITSVAFSVTFPLMFVAEKSRRLSLLAIAALLVHLPLALAAAALGGLRGLAIALALTTALVVAALLFELRALRPASRGLGIAALTAGAAAAVAFILPRLVLGPFSAAAAGCVLYAGLLLAARPKGLIEAWRYLHQLA